MPCNVLVSTVTRGGKDNGDVVDVRATTVGWGRLEIRPDFTRVHVTDGDVADLEFLAEKWTVDPVTTHPAEPNGSGWYRRCECKGQKLSGNKGLLDFAKAETIITGYWQGTNFNVIQGQNMVRFDVNPTLSDPGNTIQDVAMNLRMVLNEVVDHKVWQVNLTIPPDFQPDDVLEMTQAELEAVATSKVTGTTAQDR